MKHSYIKGLTFGLASGIVTTLGLMVGLASGTESKLAVLGGILTIAVADSLSDGFGNLISGRSSKENQHAEIWEAAIATFVAKFFFALTFAVPILLFDLISAVWVSIIWALFLLTVASMFIAKWREESKFRMIFEHWAIAILVVVLSYYTGVLIKSIFDGIPN